MHASPASDVTVGWVATSTAAVDRTLDAAEAGPRTIVLARVDVALTRQHAVDRLVVAYDDAMDAIDELERVSADVPVIVYGRSFPAADRLYECGVAELVPVDLDDETAVLLLDRAVETGPRGDGQWFREFGAAMPIGFALLADDGTIQRCNERYAEPFDATPAELRGRDWADLHGPAATTPLRDVASGTTDSWSGELPPLDIPELPSDASRLDGDYYSLFAVGGRVAAIRHTVPGQNRPASVAVEESQMLRALLREAPASIYFKDAAGRHVRVSDHAARLLTDEGIVTPSGDLLVEPRDFCGLTDREIYGELLWKESMVDDRLVIEGGETILNKEEQSVHDSGEVGWVRTSKAPWRDEAGDVVGLLGVTTDITESKRNAIAIREQRDRLDEFAEIISHDLRNPLAVASAWLDEVEGNDEPVGKVRDALDRIEHIVTDLLTLARDGRAVDELVDVDVEVLARRAWAMVDTADATLTVTDSVQVPGDPDRLCHLFENLFRNSVEHGDDDVAVTVGRLGEPTGFFVEDDGPGIRGDDPETVLQPGYTTSAEGTGFGLSIVTRLADAHGWSVGLEESADGGVRFEFREEPDQ